MPSQTITSGPLSVTISQNGIDSMSIAGAVITCAPQPGAPTAQGWFNSGIFANGLSAPPSSNQRALFSFNMVVVDSDNGLLHTRSTYSISARGDLEISVAITNRYASPVNGVAISLPSFDLGALGVSNIPSWNAAYLIAEPWNCFHPCSNVRYGVQYLRGSNYAVAFHCPSHFDRLTLFNAWTASAGLSGNQQSVQFYSPVTIAPGATETFRIIIRITQATDLASITSSYRADLIKFTGPMKYANTDDRGWIMAPPPDLAWRSPTNPLAYNTANSRFDTAAGIAAFETMIQPLVGLAQGVMFWMPQGIEPLPGGADPSATREMYSAAFDVWDANVTANLPSLFSWLASNGMKAGLLAQPGLIETPSIGGGTTAVELDCDEENEIQMLLGRFDNVARLGANAYYFDNFGDDFNSELIAAQVRKHVGPNVPCYAESPCDLVLPYCGIYCEPERAIVNGNLSEELQLARLIYPRCAILLKCFGSVPITAEQIIAWRVSPLTFDSNAANDVPFYREINAAMAVDSGSEIIWPTAHSY